MKKFLLALLATGLLAGGAFAQAPQKRVALSLSAALLFDSEESGGAQWGMDLRAGFRLGRRLQLSPEIMYAGFAGHSFLFPGVMLNYMGREIFAGAGLVFPLQVSGYGGSESSVAAKFVLGYAKGPIILTGFFMGSITTDEYTSLFEHNRIGLTAGFRF